MLFPNSPMVVEQYKEITAQDAYETEIHDSQIDEPD